MNKKYNDKPLYVINGEPQEEIGYKKEPQSTTARLPWSHEVMNKLDKRADKESPLKQWWYKEQEKNNGHL